MTTLPVALDAHAPPLDHLVALAEAIDRGTIDADPLEPLERVDRPAPPVRDAASCAGHAPGDPIPGHLLIRVVAPGPHLGPGDRPRPGARPGPGDRLHPGAVELGLLPIDGHPFDHLIGLVAPDDWWAVGVVAHGRARPWPDGDNAAGRGSGPKAPSRRARTTHLVARTGDAASVLRLGDDDPLTERHPDAARTGSLGAIDDGLRRVLGLPSAPPPPTTAELWAVCWLDELRTSLGAGALDGGHWPSVAVRHPIFTLVPELGADCDATTDGRVREWAIEHLDRAGRHFAHRITWARLLADERLRDRPIHLDRRALTWMDEGLFARQLLATLEAPGDLLDLVAPGLSPSVVRRVRLTLRRWLVPLHRT